MTFIERIKAYAIFTKFFLSFEVVISAILGYFFIAQSHYVLSEVILLFIGGSFLTAAAIGSNQIWERNTDKMMNRTKNRPLPSGEMSLVEGYAVVIIFLSISLVCLWFLGFNVFWLGVLSYVSYSFIYTPIKRVSSISSFVGAFPGSLPPLIGAVAANKGVFDFEAGIMFFIQFIWQFPHFWAIAWKHHESYKQGGFSLLPTKKGKSKESAFLILLYAFLLIPMTAAPYFFNEHFVFGIGKGLTGGWSLILGTILSVWFFLSTLKLYKTLNVQDAQKAMMASVIYLPIVQIILVLDKCPVGGCSSFFGF